MNPPTAAEVQTSGQTPTLPKKLRAVVEISAAILGALAVLATGCLWLFSFISDAAIRRESLPKQVAELAEVQKVNTGKIGELEKKAEASLIDRTNLHREVAESRAALSGSIKDLADALSRRLDRLDDRTERIGDRVGVERAR
jgi:hypothetical protein